MTKTHMRAVHKYGDTICLSDGCENKAAKRGMCQKHYARWYRTGHDGLIADDWGKRQKHPLYKTWNGVMTHQMSSGRCCEEWQDFWKFVEDVKEKPKGHYRLTRIDCTQVMSKNNFFWQGYEKSETVEHAKEKRVRKIREWHERNRERSKAFNIRKTYKLEIEDYQAMLESQNHVCALCLRPERSNHNKTNKIRSLSIDHCHKTNKVRGLLCGQCNTALGSFKDNIETMQRAIDYLKTHASTA